MKNSYFLKKTHIPVSAYLILTYATLCVLLLIITVNNRNMILGCLMILFAITILLFALIKLYNGKGVYIDNDKVYYKNIKKQIINIESIKGIKVVKAYTAKGKYGGFYPLRDREGNELYTIVLLKNITEDMINFSEGDLWFIQEFKNQIFCSAVYEEDAIEYLKLLNPNIKII